MQTEFLNINNKYINLNNQIQNSAPVPQKEQAYNTLERTPKEDKFSADDGKISTTDKAKNFLAGIIAPFTMMFSSAKNFAIGAASIAGGALLIAATGGALAPVLVAGGIIGGGIQLAKSAYKASSAITDDEACQAWQGMGTGTTAVAGSILGSKSALKGAGVDTSKMNVLSATAECFKQAPKSISNSFKAFSSGAFITNIKNAFHPKKNEQPKPDEPDKKTNVEPDKKTQSETKAEVKEEKPKVQDDPKIKAQAEAQRKALIEKEAQARTKAEKLANEKADAIQEAHEIKRKKAFANKSAEESAQVFNKPKKIDLSSNNSKTQTYSINNGKSKYEITVDIQEPVNTGRVTGKHFQYDSAEGISSIDLLRDMQQNNGNFGQGTQELLREQYQYLAGKKFPTFESYLEYKKQLVLKLPDKQLESLSKAVDSGLKTDHTFYRGLRLENPNLSENAKFGTCLKNCKTGDIITPDWGTMCTSDNFSLVSEYTADALLKIKAPKGTRLYGTTNETRFPAMSQFKVLNNTNHDGLHIIELEYITPKYS